MNWDLQHEIHPAEVDDYAVVRVETLPPGVPAYPFLDQTSAQQWLDDVRYNGKRLPLVGALTPWAFAPSEEWAIVAKCHLSENDPR